MKKPDIPTADYLVFIADGEGQSLAQCVIGYDAAVPDDIAMLVNVRPNLDPAVILKAIEILGKCFTASKRGADVNGVPATLTGDPIQ